MISFASSLPFLVNETLEISEWTYGRIQENVANFHGLAYNSVLTLGWFPRITVTMTKRSA